jgi:hypothetical protein
MEPLELGKGGEAHVQCAVVLWNTLERDVLEFRFDIGGELSRERFR